VTTENYDKNTNTWTGTRIQKTKPYTHEFKLTFDEAKLRIQENHYIMKDEGKIVTDRMTYDSDASLSNELKEMKEKAKKSKGWMGIMAGGPILMIMAYYFSVGNPFLPKITPDDYCKESTSLIFPPDDSDSSLYD
jgi:hypothetical protein